MEPAPTESPLLCPVCDYNLTGLPENRCPECGNAFDPAELAAIARGDPRPICCGATGHPAYIPRVWWTTLTSPRHFARHFPPAHDRVQAVTYSLVCYAVAAFAFCVGTAGALGGIAPGICVGSLLACGLCEVGTAAVLAALVRPLRSRRAYHLWRGLTNCTSGFTVLTAGWGVVATNMELPWILDTLNEWEKLAWGAAAAIFLWWVATLCIMVVERSGPGARRWIACLLLPAIGAGAIFLGFWLSFGCGLLMFSYR